jgi:hypothetical protein
MGLTKGGTGGKMGLTKGETKGNNAGCSTGALVALVALDAAVGAGVVPPDSTGGKMGLTKGVTKGDTKGKSAGCSTGGSIGALVVFVALGVDVGPMVSGKMGVAMGVGTTMGVSTGGKMGVSTGENVALVPLPKDGAAVVVFMTVGRGETVKSVGAALGGVVTGCRVRMGRIIMDDGRRVGGDSTGRTMEGRRVEGAAVTGCRVLMGRIIMDDGRRVVSDVGKKVGSSVDGLRVSMLLVGDKLGKSERLKGLSLGSSEPMIAVVGRIDGVTVGALVVGSAAGGCGKAAGQGKTRGISRGGAWSWYWYAMPPLRSDAKDWSRSRLAFLRRF